MEKKSLLLTTLKKQVVALKTQLEKLETKEPRGSSRHQKQSYQSKHNQGSITHSSRFDSINLDGLDLDRGKRKSKGGRYQFKNLAEVIR